MSSRRPRVRAPPVTVENTTDIRIYTPLREDDPRLKSSSPRRASRSASSTAPDAAGLRIVSIGELHTRKAKGNTSIVDWVMTQHPIAFVNEYPPGAIIHDPEHIKLHQELEKKGVSIVPGGTQPFIRTLHGNTSQSLVDVYYGKFSKDGFSQVLAAYKREYAARQKPYAPGGWYAQMAQRLAGYDERSSHVVKFVNEKFNRVVKPSVLRATDQDDLVRLLVHHRDLLLLLLLQDMINTFRYNGRHGSIVILHGQAHVESMDWLVRELGFLPVERRRDRARAAGHGRMRAASYVKKHTDSIARIEGGDALWMLANNETETSRASHALTGLSGWQYGEGRRSSLPARDRRGRFVSRKR